VGIPLLANLASPHAGGLLVLPGMMTALALGQIRTAYENAAKRPGGLSAIRITPEAKRLAHEIQKNLFDFNLLSALRAAAQKYRSKSEGTIYVGTFPELSTLLQQTGAPPEQIEKFLKALDIAIQNLYTKN